MYTFLTIQVVIFKKMINILQTDSAPKFLPSRKTETKNVTISSQTNICARCLLKGVTRQYKTHILGFYRFVTEVPLTRFGLFSNLCDIVCCSLIRPQSAPRKKCLPYRLDRVLFYFFRESKLMSLPTIN